MFQGLFSNQLGRILYAGWEWAFMRAGFAVAVWFATWHTWRPWAIDIHDDYDVSRANGIPSLFDLSAIGQPGPTFVLGGLMILLLVLYAVRPVDAADDRVVVRDSCRGGRDLFVAGRGSPRHPGGGAGPVRPVWVVFLG